MGFINWGTTRAILTTGIIWLLTFTAACLIFYVIYIVFQTGVAVQVMMYSDQQFERKVLKCQIVYLPS